ncbi:hypothetical protein C0J52_01842 [Blattella germanica]|nr:hypothetical protein C0J52_01842 [Blattella germanica]
MVCKSAIFLHTLAVFSLIVRGHGSIPRNESFGDIHFSSEPRNSANEPTTFRNEKAVVEHSTTPVNKPTDSTTLQENLSDTNSGNDSANMNSSFVQERLVLNNANVAQNDFHESSNNNPYQVDSSQLSNLNVLMNLLQSEEDSHNVSVKNINFRYVLRYLYVETVKCGACSENETCYTHKNISDDDEMSDLIFGADQRVNNDEYLSDSIVIIISELIDMEDLLYALYNRLISASMTFSCKLDQIDGSYALNLSRTYVKGRKNFIDKMIKLVKLINDPNTSIVEGTDDMNAGVSSENKKLDIPDVALYEKNLHFAENITTILEILTSLLVQQKEIENELTFMNSVVDHTKSYPDILLLTTTVRKLRHLESIYNKSVSNIQYFNSMFACNNMLANIFNTSAVSKLIDKDKWVKNSAYTTMETDVWMLHLDSKKSIAVFYESVEVVLLGIIFVIGIAGNGLLLIIFIRHREIRTNPNIMLMNIAIADILFLFASIPIFYSGDSFLDDVICKVYHCVRVICVGVSVYSLVMISIQRFFSLSVFFKRGGCLRRRSKSVLVISIWAIGIVFAIPYGFLAGVETDGSCYDIKYKEVEYRAGTTLFDVIMLCILPVCFITTFGALTFDALENGIYNEENKAKAQNKLSKVGVLTSDVLIALSIVYAISFLPFYMFRFAFVWSDTKVDILYYEYILYLMPYLVYINSCLNPIALYVASKRYRGYFNIYVLCGREAVSIDIGNTPPISASNTTVESTL